jgi:hypothetical protein
MFWCRATYVPLLESGSPHWSGFSLPIRQLFNLAIFENYRSCHKICAFFLDERFAFILTKKFHLRRFFHTNSSDRLVLEPILRILNLQLLQRWRFFKRRKYFCLQNELHYSYYCKFLQRRRCSGLASFFQRRRKYFCLQNELGYS